MPGWMPTAKMLDAEDDAGTPLAGTPHDALRVAELRIDLDNAQKKIDQLEFFIRHEQGVWLETRDANQRLTKELAASTNYIADCEVHPATIWFANGRRVSIDHTEVTNEIEGGDAYLEVDTFLHPTFAQRTP